MKKIFTLILLVAVFGISLVQAQQTREYANTDMEALLLNLEDAVNGDVFVLTTAGDVDFYQVDSMCLEIHADVTIKAADGLTVKPLVKLVDNDDRDVDYLVRLKAADCALSLEGIELQGDTAKTKYGIRTAKISDLTDFYDYDDPTYDSSIVQTYELNIMDCDINGIKSGTDGRAIILYPGTYGTVNIENTTFSAIERNGINIYNDSDNTTANGPWKFVDELNIKNCTFYNIGREAIIYRNSGEKSEDNLSMESLVDISYCTFDSVSASSPSSSYYPLRVDYAELNLKSSIFSNITHKSYIIGDNNNEESNIDNIAFWNVYKWDSDAAVDFDNVKDAVSVESASLGETFYMNELDPMYADRENADYTIGNDSPLATMAIGDLRWTNATQFAADEAYELRQAIKNAVAGDVFELITDGGVYALDDYLRVYDSITIKAAYGLKIKPTLTIPSGEDYFFRLYNDTTGLELSGIVLQGDGETTKYGIRTADGTGNYEDHVNNGTVEQMYYLKIDNCDFKGITKGGDGSAIYLYPSTYATSISITNSTFSAIERNAIECKLNSSESDISMWNFFDSVLIENSTFYNIGRDVITIKTADDAPSKANRLFIDHCTFDSIGWNNTDPDKYHVLEIDYVDATITNSIITNDVSEKYLFSLKNANSSVDYIGVFGNPTVDSVEMFDTGNGATVGDNMIIGDPLYVDRLNADFTIGKGSAFIGMASDGMALGDLRWDIWNNDASLSDLQVDAVTIDGFKSDSLEYVFESPYGTTDIPVVLATAMVDEAMIEMVSATTLPGTWLVNVTAENGVDTMQYTVELTITDPSMVATLDSLTVDGDAIPDFAADSIAYIVELPLGTTDIPVIDGVVTDETSTVVYNQATELPGSATVVVTAQDGVTSTTYTVEYIWGANNVSSLSDLTVGGTSVDGFASDVFAYSVELPFGTTDAPEVLGTATDENADVTNNQATELPGDATVVIIAENGITTDTYTVSFTIGDEVVDPTYTVTFIVVGKDAVAAEGAVVTFNSANVISDAEGKAMFEEVAAITDAVFTVEMEDYEVYSGTVSVVDKDVTVDVVLVPVGIAQNDVLTSNLYPNPTSGVVFFELKNEMNNAKVTVTDISGKVIETRELTQLENSIDLSSNKQGVYFITISSDNQIYQGKVILN